MIIDYYIGIFFGWRRKYLRHLDQSIPFFFYPCRLYLLRPTVQAYCGTSQLVRVFLFLATLFFHSFQINNIQ
jgi:hypothetical protein